MIKQYPRSCCFCGLDAVNAVAIRYCGQVRISGELKTVFMKSLPVDKCNYCGEIYFTTRTDEAINAHISKVT